jgi:hypothetical protein
LNAAADAARMVSTDTSSMDTLEDSKQCTRRHGAPLKEQVLAECAQPHAFLAALRWLTA